MNYWPERIRLVRGLVRELKEYRRLCNERLESMFPADEPQPARPGWPARPEQSVRDPYQGVLDAIQEDIEDDEDFFGDMDDE